MWSSSGDGGSQLVDNLLCTPDYTIPNATDDIYDIVTDEDGMNFVTMNWMKLSNDFGFLLSFEALPTTPSAGMDLVTVPL